jgi:uncharacterized membrane protein
MAQPLSSLSHHAVAPTAQRPRHPISAQVFARLRPVVGHKTPAHPRPNGYLFPTLAALAGYGALSWLILKGVEEQVYFRFDLSPLLTTTLAVQIHVAAALSALLLGAYLMLAPKGAAFRWHKEMGWAWVVLMGITAVSSFFITGLMGHWYSPIHALSALTMIALPFGIAAVRQRDLAEHRKTMTGMFYGGMLLAGLFSFLPGRMMWSIFFSV